MKTLLLSFVFSLSAFTAEIQRETAATAPRPQFRSAEKSVGLKSDNAGGTAVERDFGEQVIVQRRAHVEPWKVTLDSQIFHTDNAALVPGGEQSDWYLRHGLGVSYTNRVKGPWFVDFSLQHYLFRYSEFDALDFDLTRFEAAVLYQAPWLDDAFLYARYSLQHIAEAGGGSQLLQSHSAILGAQKVWKVSRGIQFHSGFSADLPLSSDPGEAARAEFGLSLGGTMRLTEKLTANASYRGAFYHYTKLDREDWNHIFALGVTYDFTDWLQLGVSASHSLNRSSAAFADYQNTVLGAAVSLRAAF